MAAFGFATIEKKDSANTLWTQVWAQQKNDFLRDLDQFEQGLDHKSQVQSQADFLQLRRSWKKWECLASYFFPAWSNEINGAPLPKVDENDGSWQTQIDPQGLQTMEELLWAKSWNSDQITQVKTRIQGLRWSIDKLSKIENLARFEKWQILDALALEIIRIQTLGMSGLDTQKSQQYLSESSAALRACGDLALLMQKNALEPEKKALQSWIQNIELARSKLKGNPERFDKISWIRNELSPLYGEIRKWQWEAKLNALGKEAMAQPSPINPKALNLFDKKFFNIDAFWKGPKPIDSMSAFALGKMLFQDQRLSANASLSCASCHQESLGFADGKPRSIGQGAKVLARNSPGLIGAFWQKTFFWDGRAKGLNEQMDHVVFSHGEFNTNYVKMTQVLHDPKYDSLVQKAFQSPKGMYTKGMINSAIAWYLYGLEYGNNPFAKWMRHEKSQISPAVLRGANLFMGKALCASCHFAPLWGGLSPPFYEENEYEVIGTPQTSALNKAVLDSDLGRAKLFPHPIWKRAFKTPSLINVAKTSPYMHHGAFQKLSQVIQFYQKGGGQGIGLKVENQTLPFDHLQLSQTEVKDLMAFLHSLSEP